MVVKIGCDIVHVVRFEQALQKGGESFLRRLFLPHEVERAASVHSLAGIFAIKESVVKAFELSTDLWLQMEVLKKENGKPTLALQMLALPSIVSHDISMSHDGEYIMATSCFLLNA